MTGLPLTLPPLSAHACVRLSASRRSKAPPVGLALGTPAPEDGASPIRRGVLPLPARGEREGVRGKLRMIMRTVSVCAAFIAWIVAPAAQAACTGVVASRLGLLHLAGVSE